MTEQRMTIGDHNVVIQNTGNDVTIAVGASSLTLVRRHLLKAAPRNERELLLTELRATDLIGRDGDLASLKAWLNDPRPIALRCLIGRGGAGKTRLGIEICERAEAAGWIAGFATQAELQRFADAKSPQAWHWGKPTLAVVDYAAGAARTLLPWLEELARRVPEPKEGRLRLLLLERHADPALGWWADLMRPGGLSGRGPEDLAAPAEPIPLTPLDAATDRRALLRQTVEMAAAILGKPVPSIPPAGLDPDFDRRLSDPVLETEPLFLLMAGLVGVTTGVPHALSLGRTDLAERVADSEAKRLRRLSRGWGCDPDAAAAAMLHFSACLTLQGGADRAAIRALIPKECAAMDFPALPPTDRLATLLAEALPRPGGADAVRPDIVGEAFLLRRLGADGRPPDEQAAIVGRAWRRDAAGTIGAIVRTAQDFATDGQAHPSLGWLDHVVSEAGDLATMLRIADAMPEHTLVLRDRIAALQSAIVEALGELAVQQPKLTADLALSLNNLAIRLSDLGRREDALAAAKKAVGLYCTLAALRLDAFRPGLARSLNTLASKLSDLGRREDALAAAKEAVGLYCALADRHPDAFQPDLALSLNNLANILSDFGRWDHALAAAKKAVGLYRTLAAQRPNAFRPNWAGSLNNLANILSHLGRREDALVAVEKALRLYRTLAAQRPDAFQPNLAGSLNNLAIKLSHLGRRKDALAAAEEAVGLRRTLAAQRPDAFRPNLAGSLMVAAQCLDAFERFEEGMAANIEAISVLTDPFVRLPQAFAPRMAAMERDYMARCEKLGREPDMALLGPVMAVFKRLQSQQKDRT